jgi:uncharacterized protein with ParB-like and HNH nuclease domain
MDAHPSTVSNILAGEKQYQIPVFQRFYSWKEDSWIRLWNDTSSLLDDTDRQIEHFIGPFVTIAMAYPHDITRFIVIDGQQRLMTFTILLSALREVATNEGLESLAKAIESNYLHFHDARGRKTYKLMPRSKDRDSLRQIVDGFADEAVQETLMVKAYNYFVKQISSLVTQNDDEDNSIEVLTNLYETLTKRLQLVMITLGSKDNPSNIFESLNFKGEKLTEADLLRNFFFMQVPIEYQDEFERKIWQPFEEYFVDKTSSGINTQMLTDFYYHYLISKTEYIQRQALYSSFSKYVTEYIKSAKEPYSKLEVLVDELKRFASHYLNIMAGQEQDKALSAAFARFINLNTNTALPLLLSLYERYSNRSVKEKLSKAELLTMLNAIESFILRRVITRERAKGYGEDFAKAIQKSQNIDDLAQYFVTKKWPTDEEVTKELITFQLYRRDRTKCALILREIERSYNFKEGPNLDSPKSFTIEHIMPQTLTQEWQNALGPDANEIHDIYLHSLGNLTLTAYNGKLGQLPYQQKRENFLKSGFRINHYFEDVDMWSWETMEQRTRDLAERFLRIWPRVEDTPPQLL